MASFVCTFTIVIVVLAVAAAAGVDVGGSTLRLLTLFSYCSSDSFVHTVVPIAAYLAVELNVYTCMTCMCLLMLPL